VKTSKLGWRIIAVGVFFLIFGFSLVSYKTGPGWIGWSMLLFGVVTMVVGRRV